MKTKGIVSFYGKIGCKTNERQVEQLKEAGYVIQFIDLLSRELEPAELQNFFNDLNIHDCVNERAPELKSGEFKPENLSAEDLLEAMVKNPVLIKRPLIFFRGEFTCGFNQPLIQRLLGERPPIEGCQN